MFKSFKSKKSKSSTAPSPADTPAPDGAAKTTKTEKTTTPTPRTHYEVLGISPKATSQEIRKAYLQLSLKHHPDKNPRSMKAEAEEEFIRVGQAHEILSNPTKRVKYDRELKRKAARRMSSSKKVQRKPSSAQRNDDDAFGNTTKPRSSFVKQQQQQKEKGNMFETYRQAFDETVAGMSEEDFKNAVGLAVAAIGIVGSLIGATCVAKNSSCARGATSKSTMTGVSSLLGTLVASEAASKFLTAIHKSSKERAVMDKEAREATGDGDTPSSSSVARRGKTTKSAATDHWNDMMSNFGLQAAEAAIASLFASSKNDKEKNQLRDVLGQAATLGAVAKAAMDNFEKQEKQARSR